MPKKSSPREDTPKKSGSLPKGKIVVSKDGPYVATGGIPLALQSIIPNPEGFSWDWKEGKAFKAGAEYYLCRCGQSRSKPFCDGTHEKVKFKGKETASRAAYVEQAEVMPGPALELRDAEALCAFARFCDPAGKIWALIEKTDDPKARELVIREASHCPGGRLVVRDPKAGREIEPELPPSIGVVEDPALQCSGPLWVRGGIPIESEGGRPYEVRNRVTLCRCGASSNKPFCDGTHASMKFQDGLA
ncbi:MAG TPA: CDGSH iron-sulfur domain-containing protein [Planctomycetota bacterium]|nr:CDGSH iron-sulfur domain-containing protein [Planctomycetota bacterium]